MPELDAIQKRILEIFEKYPNSLLDPKLFRSLLSDTIPEYSAQRNVLLSAYNEGVFEIIKDAKDLKSSLYIGRKKLENDAGISADFAVWGVETIALLFHKYDENEDDEQSILELSKRIAYKNGFIDYISEEEGICIKKVFFDVGDRVKPNTYIVIPEKIYGMDVVSVSKDAFSELVASKIKNIILPYSLRRFGNKDEEKATGKSKGRQAKVEYYLARNKYELCNDCEEFYDSLIKENDLFIFVSKRKTINSEHIRAFSTFIKDGYWTYPEDGLWITNQGALKEYTGNDKKVFVDCNAIRSGVFVDSDIEEIVFSDNVHIFSANIIYDCKKLKKITFKRKGRYQLLSTLVHDCPSLEEFNGDWNHNCNVSLYYNCPLLGNMEIKGRLLTYQSEDEVIVLDKEYEYIVEHAFLSCAKTKIICIKRRIESVSTQAFEGSGIESIIMEEIHTRLDLYNFGLKQNYFLYADQKIGEYWDISPHKNIPRVYIKNIEFIDEFLKPELDEGKLKEYCYSHKDKEHDEGMIPKPYGWNREYYETGWA